VLLPSLLALALLSSPAGAEPLRGSFDSVVPRLPGGYGPGRVCIRVHTVPLPEGASPALVGDLVARTGALITDTQGIRIEVVLPDDVEFISLEARVVDGLVLQPERKSLLRRVGSALVSLLRILLIGQFVSAADDLAVSGTVWAAALGAPDADDELVRLSTSDTLAFDRGMRTFSDHGRFVVCRAVAAFSPWTELVDVRIEGHDRTTGQKVALQIPRIPLHENEVPGTAPERAASWQWVMADR
jgi:hypothetical protein